MSENTVRDVIIIGAGPAGLTAALYTARAELEPLVFAGYELPGGQLMTTTDIENFPGFPQGIGGPELMDNMFAQAERFGAEIVRDQITRVDFSERPFKCWIEEDLYLANSIIISTGAEARRLGIESESKYFGVGHPGSVTTCATCDGAYYKGVEVAVIGGGDSAMEEATFLTRYASKVHVIHRREELRASKVMQQRAFDDPKVEFIYSHTIDEVLGDGQRMTGLRLRSTEDDSTSDLKVVGMFLAIGHVPTTALFKGQIDLDDEGYIQVDPHQRTNIPGVFACGDVHDTRYRQAITAAGMGCAASLEAQHFLADVVGEATGSQLYHLPD